MTNVITFSGWGQNHNALENIAPKAKHINYKDHDNICDMFDSINGLECDVVIGWSLGGQLALRALESGALKAKSVVLLATPFQFIKGEYIKCGIDADVFNNFQNQFKTNPKRTLKQFSLLIAQGDKDAKMIANKLKDLDTNDASRWLYWLSELQSFSGHTINYNKIPKTLAINGRDDKVIDSTQIDLFRPLIKSYKSTMFENCGHAPHLHNENKVIQLIKDAA